MLGDVDRARDAVQEAFAHALRHRGDLREAESVNAWLWQIMVNVCRAEKRHQVMGLDDSYEFEANRPSRRLARSTSRDSSSSRQSQRGRRRPPTSRSASSLRAGFACSRRAWKSDRACGGRKR